MRVPSFIVVAFVFCLTFLISASPNDAEVSEYEKLLEQINLLNAEKDSLLRENVEIKKSKNQLEKNIEQLTKKSSYILELGKLEEKYKQLEMDTNSKISALTDTVTRTERERDQARAEAIQAAAIQPNADLEIEVEALREETASRKSLLESNAAALDACTHSNLDLEAKLVEANTLLHRMTAERDQLHADVRAAGGMVTKAQKEAHMTKDRYQAASKKIAEQANTIRELELHHDRCRGVANQFETQVSTLQVKLGRNPLTVFKEKLAAVKNKFLRWLRIKKDFEMWNIV
eukprot:gene11086-12919_t